MVSDSFDPRWSADDQIACLEAWRDTYAADIVGDAPDLLRQLDLAASVANTDCNVLITGETGTGKELMARSLHAASDHADGPMVALNCAALPDSLIEDDLFGHEAGAFTGADKRRQGRILAAHGGTLFLDEIGEMPLAAQAKLLRVLEERKITPVGSDESIDVDIRVVAATNRDLTKAVHEGTFRADLLYRLEVIHLELPPLRERAEDVVLLAKRFLKKAAERYRRPARRLSEDAKAVLCRYRWPGNIRELANTIERAVLCTRTEEIEVAALRLKNVASPLESASGEALVSLDLKAALRERERHLISVAMEKSNGNRTEAAALLGLNRTTLVEKLRKVTA